MNMSNEYGKKYAIYAVITGDVIASRRSGPAKWLPHLKHVLAQFGRSPECWDVYRGDAFQLLLNSPEEVLWVAMRIKAGFKSEKGLDLRMAMGLGRMDFHTQSVGESSGEAFVNAGALVENLDVRRSTLAVATPWPDFDGEMNASLALAAALMDKWLPNYAEAVAAFMATPGLTQRALGDKLGIAQNTLSERYSKAQKRALLAFEAVFRQKLLKKLAESERS